MIANKHIKLQGPVLRRNKFFSMFFLCVIYVWAMIHTYVSQIAEENAYAGMQPWEMTSTGWVILAIILPLIALISSRIKGNPSDFFVNFYLAISVISFFVLTSTSGKIKDFVLILSLLIIFFPLLVMWVLQYLIPKIRWFGVIPSAIIERTLIAILFTVIIFSYFNAPVSAGFDIITSYDRRLEGRDLYAPGSLIAYALGMCMNGFAPYLAFKGAINDRPLLVLAAFSAVVFFYWLLSVKAPAIYVLMGFAIGLLARRNNVLYFIKYFIIIIVGLYFFILFEWYFFNDYSVIADFGFRRLFAVQAEVQGYYLDFLIVDPPSAWSWLIGIPDQSFQATFFVGEKYFGNPSANVNTNAFLYAFAANGFLGYFFSIIFVSSFLIVLDRLYRSTQNPTYLLIGFVYGILIIEQAFSTAMISSGVGLLFLLTFLEKHGPPITATARLKKANINREVR
jgi:hypothetical protein